MSCIGGDFMVYCHNCGTKNEDDAEFCSKCGTALKDEVDYDGRRRARKRDRDGCFGSSRDERDECFGLPHGGLIVAAIIGILLIIGGISSIYNIDLGPWVGPMIIIIIGILIIAGAIYGFRKRK
jgi:hypothetical protein